MKLKEYMKVRARGIVLEIGNLSNTEVNNIQNARACAEVEFIPKTKMQTEEQHASSLRFSAHIPKTHFEEYKLVIQMTTLHQIM